MCTHLQVKNTIFSAESVSVQLWTLGEYIEDETQLPRLIDPDWINSQLAMTTVSVGVKKTKVWVTIDLVCQTLFEQDIN